MDNILYLHSEIPDDEVNESWEHLKLRSGDEINRERERMRLEPLASIEDSRWYLARSRYDGNEDGEVDVVYVPIGR